MSAEQTIRILEVVRNTTTGRVVYVIYQGRTLRRELRRGRPHYAVVSGIELRPGEGRWRNVNVNSQVARGLLAKVL
jgi:hypothetical protein